MFPICLFSRNSKTVCNHSILTISRKSVAKPLRVVVSSKVVSSWYCITDGYVRLLVVVDAFRLNSLDAHSEDDPRIALRYCRLHASGLYP